MLVLFVLAVQANFTFERENGSFTNRLRGGYDVIITARASRRLRAWAAAIAPGGGACSGGTTDRRRQRGGGARAGVVVLSRSGSEPGARPGARPRGGAASLPVWSLRADILDVRPDHFEALASPV